MAYSQSIHTYLPPIDALKISYENVPSVAHIQNFTDFSNRLPRRLLAYMLWEKGVIDENCIVTAAFQARSILSLDSVQTERVIGLLDRKVAIFDRDGKIPYIEETNLGTLLKHFHPNACDLVGGIVPYLLGPAYFLRVLKDLEITVSPDSPIMSYLEEEFTRFPVDIDARSKISERDHEKEALEKLVDETGRDSFWIIQNGFTKRLHINELPDKFFYIHGFRGEFLDNKTPFLLDSIEYKELSRLHLFICDALRLDIATFTLVSDLTCGLQAVIDRLLKIARIDIPETCDHYAWPMTLIRQAQGYLTLGMSVDENLDTKEALLLDKVLSHCLKKTVGSSKNGQNSELESTVSVASIAQTVKTAPYTVVLKIIELLRQKWENHIKEDEKSLLLITYEASCALVRREIDVTRLWKEMTLGHLFVDLEPPHLYLLHILITRANRSFQEAKALIEKKEALIALVVPLLLQIKDLEERKLLSLLFSNFFDSTPMADVSSSNSRVLLCYWLAPLVQTQKWSASAIRVWKKVSEECTSEERFLFARLISATHSVEALQAIRSIATDLDPEALLAFLQRVSYDDLTLLFRVTIQALETRVILNPPLHPFLAQVKALGDIGNFTHAIELLHKLLQKGGISHALILQTWQEVCQRALVHPQGGKLTALTIWHEAVKRGCAPASSLPSFVQDIIARLDVRLHSSITELLIAYQLERIAVLQERDGDSMCDSLLDFLLMLPEQDRNELMTKFLQKMILIKDKRLVYKAYSLWEKAYTALPHVYKPSFQHALRCLAISGDVRIRLWHSDQKLRAPFLEELEQDVCRLSLLTEMIATSSTDEEDPKIVQLLTHKNSKEYYSEDDLADLWGVFLIKILERRPTTVARLEFVFCHAASISKGSHIRFIERVSSAQCTLLTSDQNITHFEQFYGKFVEFMRAISSERMCRTECIRHFKRVLEIDISAFQHKYALANLLLDQMMRLQEEMRSSVEFCKLFDALVYWIVPENSKMYQCFAQKALVLAMEIGEQKNVVKHTLYLGLKFLKNVAVEKQGESLIQVVKTFLDYDSPYALGSALLLLTNTQSQVPLEYYRIIFTGVSKFPFYSIAETTLITLAISRAWDFLQSEQARQEDKRAVAVIIVTRVREVINELLQEKAIWRALFLTHWTQDIFFRYDLKQELHAICKLFSLHVPFYVDRSFPIDHFPRALQLMQKYTLPLVGLQVNTMMENEQVDYETRYAIDVHRTGQTIAQYLQNMLVECNKATAGFFSDLYLQENLSQERSCVLV